MFSETGNASVSEQIIDQSYDSIVDFFIGWADNSAVSPNMLRQLFRGFAINGIYPTVQDVFHIFPVFDVYSKDFDQE